MSIIKWKTLEEVAYRANNTPYGLAAGVWSKSADTIQYLSRSLKAGSVFVNCYNIFDAALPFGGARPGMCLHSFAAALNIHTRK
jgi:aldehyde dehydrogenase (NAD+)